MKKRNSKLPRLLGLRVFESLALRWNLSPWHGTFESANNTRPLTIEQLETRIPLNVDWRNPVDNLDVNNDLTISPLDALVVINYLNSNTNGARSLPTTRNPTEPFLDTTGNQSVEPLDVLLIINFLNVAGSGPRTVSERGQFVTQQDISITLGQTEGTRLYSLEVSANFGASNSASRVPDLFSVYLVDPADPSKTLLDRGVNGTSLFSLSPHGVEMALGLVRWDGHILEIDLSSIKSNDTGLLRVQLLNGDPINQSSVSIRPLENSISSERIAGTLLSDSGKVRVPGPTMNLVSLTSTSNVQVDVKNVRFDSALATFIAEVEIKNLGTAIGRDVALLFPGLPSGVTLSNASGLSSDGVPYLNLREAIRTGGLGTNSQSNRVELQISNPGAKLFTLQPQILVGASNRAPALDDIQTQTVKPGGHLAIQLSATDADNDQVTYAVRGTGATGRLPTSRLQSGTGSLVFTPTLNDLGMYQIEVTASDGVLSSSKTFAVNVVADPMTTTRVSGRVLKIDQTPLVGVKVEIGSVQGLTLADGSFTLDLGSGTVVSDTLKVRGELYPGPLLYPFIAEKLAFILDHQVFAGANNVINRPIYLPSLDIANGKTINPTQDTKVTTAAIPGVEVMVKAGTLMNQQGTPFSGVLSITEVPQDLTPAALPDNMIPDLVVTIQPGEMVFTTPAPLTFPNRAGWAPGTQMDLWSINPITGEFETVGQGMVSDDGTVIHTSSGGIRNSSWHFFSLRKKKPEIDKMQVCGCGVDKDFGSSVDLYTGAVHEALAMPTYQSQGSVRGVQLVYNSLRANPQALVRFNYTADQIPVSQPGGSQQFLVGRLTLKLGDLEYQVGGFRGGNGLPGGEHFWKIASAGDISGAILADLSDVPTGRYQYTLDSGILLQNSSGAFSGTLNQTTDYFTHISSIDSSVGAGWGIAGHQQLVEANDGSVVLIDGGGIEDVYTASAENARRFVSLRGNDFGVIERSDQGRYRRTLPDQTVAYFNASNMLERVKDRNGNETTWTYDTAGNPTQMVDPAGLITSLSYAGNKLASITDPANRTISMTHDAEGNLLKALMPDNTEKRWAYTESHLITSSLDQRGFKSTHVYDNAGRAASATRADGGTIRVQSVLSQALSGGETTFNPGSASVAATNGTVARYTDANGNIESIAHDRFGQLARSQDALGVRTSITRNDQNLVTSVVNARGVTQSFVYDAAGNVTQFSDIQGGIPDLTSIDWTLLHKSESGTGPDRIDYPAVAYDSSRKVVVLFGGRSLDSSLPTNDTWEWDGTNWTKREFVTKPRPMDWHSMVYDSVRDEIVLYTASTTSFAGTRETWVYDGTQWQRKTTSQSPPALWGHSMAFDSDRGVTVLFGGATSPASLRNQTWEWNGETWSRVATTGPRGASANSHSMTYDSIRKKTLLLLQSAAGPETWEWDGAVWEMRNVENPILGGLSPSQSLVFYEAAGIVLYHARLDPTSQTWAWDGIKWTQLATPKGMPAEDHDLVYDSAKNVVLLFGTIDGDELWQGSFPNLNTGHSGATGRRLMTYDSQFNQGKTITDELNRRTVHEIDPANGNVLITNRPDGEKLRYTYTASGQVDTMTDPNGHVTDYDYDTHRRLIRVTLAKGTADESVMRYEYDNAGNTTAVIDGNNHRTEYEFDVLNRRTQIRDAQNNETRYEYDRAGNVIKIRDSRGADTIYDYDSRNRLVRTTDVQQNVMRYEYDRSGNLASVADPLGHVTRHRYDLRNRRIETIDPDRGVTLFRYDGEGNLVALTDPVGNQTLFFYDDRNRLIEERDPLGKKITYGYDGADNLVLKTDRNERVTRFEYDSLNRLFKESWVATADSTANTITYTYDPMGNLLKVKDGFSELTYTYDARDRVRSVDNAGTPRAPQVLLNYTYDTIGSVTSVTDTIDLDGSGTAAVPQPGAITGYVYDSLDRLTRLTQTAAAGSTGILPVSDKRVDFTYNSLGQYDHIRRNSNLDGTQLVIDTAYTYDDLNRLKAIDHRNSSGTAVSFFHYKYDAASRITQVTDIDGTTNYSYDNRDQLTAADHTDSNNPDESYRYDANGNRLQSHLHGTGYRTGTGNRLLSDGTYNYIYDNEGNTSRRTEIATGKFREFQWDHRNRLIAVIDKLADGSLTQEVHFSYDALNRRIVKAVETTPTDAIDAVYTHFVYDREDVLLDFVDLVGSGTHTNGLTVRYLHGSRIDQVLAQEESNSIHWLLTDHLGTIRTVVIGTSSQSDEILYDSFGNANTYEGSPLEIRFGFTSREHDGESGLSYYRARYYDSFIGRFISEDSRRLQARQHNLYSYVENVVLDRMDPSGNDSQPASEALPPDVQNLIKTFLPTIDLEFVMIHDNGRIPWYAFSSEAKAWTPGSNDIYFNYGQFDPNTIEGIALIMHEMVHVSQHPMQASYLLEGLFNDYEDISYERQAHLMEKFIKKYLAEKYRYLPYCQGSKPN